VLNPEIAKNIADQRRSELRATATECRRTPDHRILPRWRVTWSRTKLSTATEKGSSVIIVISSSRSVFRRATRGASRAATQAATRQTALGTSRRVA
jgi:hypothetical protein